MALINPKAIGFGRPSTRGKVPNPAQTLYVPFDFSATADTEIDLSLNIDDRASNQIGIKGIQSVKIDNSNNLSNFTLFSPDTPDTLVCPAKSQAIFPFFFNGQYLNVKGFSVGAVLVPVLFMNSREQAAIWSAAAVITGNVNVTGSTILASLTNGNSTDRFATLGVANTSQQLMAANAARKAFWIRNPATAASEGIGAPEPVVIQFGAAAALNAGGIELLPGESISSEAIGICSAQQINWIAATAGHILQAQEY